MSSPDERTPGFGAEPESSASGGHMPSVGRPAGSFFDPGDAAMPSDIERERRSEEARTAAQEVFATGQPQPRPTGPRTGQQMRRRPRGRRRVRRTIQRIDPISVLKISVIFYAVVLLVWLVFVTLLYNVLDGLGFFEAIENINEGLVLDAEFDVTLGVVLRWAALIGILFSVAASILNTLLALLYNGIARVVGGLEITFVEREV